MRTWVCAILLAVAVHAAAAASPLMEAARRGDGETARRLIAAGTDVGVVAPDGTSALMWAAHHGDAALVEALLAAGADVGRVNEFGATALGEAAITGDAAVLDLLLAAGADPDSANPEGQTALMAVARTGRVPAARLLVAAGADVNAVEAWGGQTALMWAVSEGQPEMVRFLIEQGGDVDARSKIHNWQRKITSEPRPKDMNKGGFTPLLYAARDNCIPCARHLIAAGADIDRPDPDRVTPLILALINLNFDMARYLVEAGADVDKWDLYGRTPLYAAIDMNTLPIGGRADLPATDDTTGLDIARLLLERGANPNIQLKLRPPYRNVPFDRGDNNSLITGATPLLRAAKASDDAAVKLLLAHGALVDLPNVMGVTPFMSAAGVDHSNNPVRGRYKTDGEAVETVRILLDAGADIHARAGEYRDFLEIYQDPSSKFKRTAHDGETALHGAAKKGWNETVRFLVARGADLQARDARGRTPLDLAYGRYEPAFLDAQPAPLEDTVALLRQLCDEAPDCDPGDTAGL